MLLALAQERTFVTISCRCLKYKSRYKKYVYAQMVRRFGNSLKSLRDTENALSSLLRAKPAKRVAATRIIDRRNGEMRRDGNSIVSSRCASHRTARTEVHRTAVARENRVGVRQCTSISPPALQLRHRERFNREIRFVYRTHTRACRHRVNRTYVNRQNKIFSYNGCVFFLADYLCLNLPMR